jgi:hypothetical protein
LHYSKVSNSFIDILKSIKQGKKTGEFRLLSDTVILFLKLKEYFIRAPFLWYFDPMLFIRIEVDISRVVIRSILL